MICKECKYERDCNWYRQLRWVLLRLPLPGDRDFVKRQSIHLAKVCPVMIIKLLYNKAKHRREIWLNHFVSLIFRKMQM